MDRAIIAWDKLNVKERKLFSIVILVTILLSVILGLSYGNIIVMLNSLARTAVREWRCQIVCSDR